MMLQRMLATSGAERVDMRHERMKPGELEPIQPVIRTSFAYEVWIGLIVSATL